MCVRQFENLWRTGDGGSEGTKPVADATKGQTNGLAARRVRCRPAAASYMRTDRSDTKALSSAQRPRISASTSAAVATGEVRRRAESGVD
jgi:hypothetical protein